MKRTIITVDETKCDGCGLCVPNCPEGALQVIDGKARLISDILCDGLGACIGHCPRGAIVVEEREAEEYDEYRVMEAIAKAGSNTIKAHLKHLKDHGQKEYYDRAIEYLHEHAILLDDGEEAHSETHCGCPGSKTVAMQRASRPQKSIQTDLPGLSWLSHWPIQMHLINPHAPHYKDSDLLLCADCVAYVHGNFHGSELRNKTLAIACPKLDSHTEVYVEKLKLLIDEGMINTLTVMITEVPCCMGLLMLAKQAAARAERSVPIKSIIFNIEGEKIKEEWLHS